MSIMYLKPNVTIEPLVSNWYAWLHLISPMTAGLHFKKRYIKILESFIEHPDLHLEASRNPQLIGGLFVNLDSTQISQASALLTKMNVKLSPVINLAEDIQSFLKELSFVEKGSSLEFLYNDLPASLKGVVEIVYDLSNNLNVRYIESLLYRRFYNTETQSFLLSMQSDSKNRPFVTSTPRLRKNDEVELHLPFNGPLIDELIVSKESGLDLDSFISRLNLTEVDIIPLRAMFTSAKPVFPSDRAYLGEGLRIRYFGHACILIQTKHVSILLDPLIGNHDSLETQYSYFDLPDIIDLVLITHAHQDHLVLETLIQIRKKVKRIIVPRNNGGFLEDPSIKIMLNHVGFQYVDYLDELERLTIQDLVITGIPFLGEHGDLKIQSKIAYHIKSEQHNFLFAVDSNNIDPKLYESIREVVGAVDTLFIGMECKGAPYSWTYGPLSTNVVQRGHDQSRRLSGSDSDKAWKIVLALGASNAYVYAMGLEPWLTYLLGVTDDKDSLPILESDKFVIQATRNNIDSKRLYLKHEWIYEKELINTQ